MKKITFNVILRMPNYYSDGLLQLIETKNNDVKEIRALFTIDKAIGKLENGVMDLDFLGHNIDISTLSMKYYGLQFAIEVGELFSPMKYYFSNDKDSKKYSIEFVSVEKNDSNIKYLENVFD